MKKKIEFLLAQLGDHPSFSLPPVSIFIQKIRTILEEDPEKSEDFQDYLDKKYGPYSKDDSRARRGY